MSTRFNRNDANVPDDRLFADDFIDDQNGQDADLLQILKDIGCLPCIGYGLGVASKSEVDHKVEVSAGWAYDTDGHRITITSAQEVVLTNTSGGNNYIILTHLFATDTARNAHRTGTEYQTRKHNSFQLAVQSSAPGADDICLANCKQTGTGAITVETGCRLSRSCRLVSQDKVPGVTQEEEGEEGEGSAPPPPPGQQEELPDYPKGRTVPMPIILSGTRGGEAWNGVETKLAEELGRTSLASTNISLPRTNLKAGTPLADVHVWIGDIGTGQRDGTEARKCNFTMPTKSGVSAWDADLWITDPPGYYYLVKHDESWYAKIVDSGSDWVLVEEGKEVPSGSAAEYYICPYAERYKSQAIPYKTDEETEPANVFDNIYAPRIASPVLPLVTIKDLNIGGKYKLRVASLVSGDNYTKWAEIDYYIGHERLKCWLTPVEYVTVVPVDGGLKVNTPAPSEGSDEPDGYEICYTYGAVGAEVAEPDFTNPEHPTVSTTERVTQLNIPPGNVAKVAVRAVKTRMVMRCEGVDKVLTPDYSEGAVIAGGVTLRRNRKMFTGLINESSVAASTAVLADQVPLANPVWPEKILLFNPQATGSTAQTDFEVYVHGATQPYSDGRKIQIASGGDQESIAAKDTAEIPISDYRISDTGLKVTIKNTDTGAQSFELRWGVQYREDSPSESGFDAS